MKTLTIKGIATLCMITLFQLAVWAQDQGGSGSGSGSTDASSSTSVTKTTTTTSVADNTFWASPWVWVVGAAVFILLLIALLRGNSSSTTTRSDRVVVSKTGARDTAV